MAGNGGNNGGKVPPGPFRGGRRDPFDLASLTSPELDREIARLSRLLLKGKS